MRKPHWKFVYSKIGEQKKKKKIMPNRWTQKHISSMNIRKKNCRIDICTKSHHHEIWTINKKLHNIIWYWHIYCDFVAYIHWLVMHTTRICSCDLFIIIFFVVDETLVETSRYIWKKTNKKTVLNENWKWNG